jgi:hypothetical protein
LFCWFRKNWQNNSLIPFQGFLGGSTERGIFDEVNDVDASFTFFGLSANSVGLGYRIFTDEVM